MSNEVVSLLLTHHGELSGYVRALVRNSADAEDLFQEAALAIVEHAHIGTDVRDFNKWAKEIVRHHVWQYYRKNGRRKSMPSEELANLSTDIFTSHSLSSAEIQEESEALRECMQQMPERSSGLLRMRFFQEWEYSQIAKSIKSSEVAVRRAVARARLLLANCLHSRFPDHKVSADHE